MQSHHSVSFSVSTRNFLRNLSAAIGFLLTTGLAQGAPSQAGACAIGHACASKADYAVGHRISEPSSRLDGVTPEAHWIWDSGEANPLNYYLHVRKSFTLDAKPSQAQAYVSAYAFGELYINGINVDRVPTNPDPVYQTYERLDLSPYLREGRNTIAALVYNAGCGLHHRMDARGGFFFQGTVHNEMSGVMKINSDASWRVTPSRKPPRRWFTCR